jgi:HptB-dependent secretion and biofilm anti anti-sigma factor
MLGQKPSKSIQKLYRIYFMSINSTVSGDGKVITIAVSGKFDFQLYDEFRTSYVDTQGTGVDYVVDLSGTDYLDSSALGMLLLLREHAGGEGSKIKISSASPDVKKVLDVANFGKLFEIN